MKMIDLMENISIMEANVSNKILRDPKMVKQVAIAWKHDDTIPLNLRAKTVKASNEDIVKAWSKLLDDSLRDSNYGDLSADGKFDDWLTRMYIEGRANYEDINGEAVDALGAWKALSIRGLLKEKDQDFNRFKSIRDLQMIRNNRQYRDELEKIKDAEKVEKAKREKSDLVLIDDKNFFVIVPFNYGACYVFGHGEGYKPNFCTSSSSGLQWFQRYAPDGIIVSIVDKNNIDNKEGKWQMHAPTNQLVNGAQDNRYDMSINDRRFAELFPGLMKRICAAILSNAEQINEMSKSLTHDKQGYNATKEVQVIQTRFPVSYASEPPIANEPEAVDDTPKTYIVTQTATGRTARLTGTSVDDVWQQLLARYPTLNFDDFTFAVEQGD